MPKRRARGEGTIYKNPKGLWVAQITLPGGKRKSKYSKSQKIVQDWLLNQRKSLQDGLLIRDESITFSQFIDRYMEDVAAHTLRPRTYQTYESIVTNHIKPEIGIIKLTQLRPDHLQSLYSRKLDSGLSKRTVQFTHSIIHKSLNQALRWGLVMRNVSDLVDAPSPKRKAPATWNSDQVKRFLSAAELYYYYPIYVLAIATGMREGELLGLHYEDIDIINSKIHVQRALQYIIGEGLLLSDLKSDEAKRSISVPGFAMQVLKDHCDQKKIYQGFVFPSKNSTPINPRNLVRSFKTILLKADLPEIRFHDLRHTCASLHLKSGTNPKIVQELLGHSQINLTLDTYSHVLPGLQEEATEKMDSLLRM